jgi:hypothetical protein
MIGRGNGAEPVFTRIYSGRSVERAYVEAGAWFQLFDRRWSGANRRPEDHTRSHSQGLGEDEETSAEIH